MSFYIIDRYEDFYILWLSQLCEQISAFPVVFVVTCDLTMIIDLHVGIRPTFGDISQLLMLIYTDIPLFKMGLLYLLYVL